MTPLSPLGREPALAHPAVARRPGGDVPRRARATPALRLEWSVALPLFALSLLAVIWGATFHFIDAECASARHAALISVDELIDTYEAQVGRNLGAIEQTLRTVTYAVKLKGTGNALAELRNEGLLPSGLVFAVGIVDRDGAIVASNPAGAETSAAAQAYFRHHVASLSDAPFVSQSRTAGGWTLHFSRRLNDEAGNFLGVAVVTVDPAYFTSGYEHARQGAQGMLGLLTDDGTMLSLRVGDRQSAGQRVALPAATQSGVAASPWDGVRRYSATRAMHGFHLRAVVGLAEREQMAAFARHRQASLWQAGAVSAVLLLLTALFGGWSRQGALARRAARLAQETYAAASEANMDAFFVLHGVRDPGGALVDFRISAANSRAEKMTGMDRRALHGLRLSDWMPQCREDGIFATFCRVTEGGHTREVEWENALPQLRARWLHAQLVGVEDGLVAIVRDISERKQADERLLYLARHDTLTGMPNRERIDTALSEEIAAAARDGGSVLVAFIDLDNFKMVNDGLGHNAGDALLVEIARRMRRCLQPGDTLGRFGGDEFVLILPAGQAGRADRIAILDAINAAVGRIVALGDHEVQVSCSIGAAVYPNDGPDAETLLRHADAAMYRAKEAGKNTHYFYTAEMNASADRKLALLEGLRAALENNELRLLYQPKVCIASGRVFGVEALLRWQHPLHGAISPMEFIPLAEESGMIVPIGQWVLQTACAQAMAWQRAGAAPLTMSVNVSARQFDDRKLLSYVADALAHSGLAPALLELEVTESLIMRDLKQAVDKMAELKAMGLALSIDDFGTGYSSLSALKSFPISRLKIDQSFVRDLAASGDDQAIACAVIALAHQLKLRVIAEGVETQAQYAFLRDHGCDEVQGYLFGRPVEPDTLLARLREDSASDARRVCALP
jgi:diguanylate cyclase (GGDEF)-like protein/PAS domain S-box-containing protein